MSACKSEDDCTHMPWCRINSKCYERDPERARLVADVDAALRKYEHTTEWVCPEVFDALRRCREALS